MTLMAFVASALVGILFWNGIAGRFEGDRLERSLRIPVGGYYIHVHHWLYCLGLMVCLYCCDVQAALAHGFLSGSIVHGLSYRDWYLVLYRRSEAHEVYAHWREA